MYPTIATHENTIYVTPVSVSINMLYIDMKTGTSAKMVNLMLRLHHLIKIPPNKNGKVLFII